MNDKILDWAMKIKSISQIGLAYTKDPYDKERYQQLEEVATQMLETKLDMNNEKLLKYFVMKKDIVLLKLILEQR